MFEYGLCMSTLDKQTFWKGTERPCPEEMVPFYNRVHIYFNSDVPFPSFYLLLCTAALVGEHI